MAKVTIDIKPHWHPSMKDTHVIAKVTTRRGTVYAQTWAQPFPTAAEVEEEWQINRMGFRRYNETTGVYVG